MKLQQKKKKKNVGNEYYNVTYENTLKQIIIYY